MLLNFILIYFVFHSLIIYVDFQLILLIHHSRHFQSELYLSSRGAE